MDLLTLREPASAWTHAVGFLLALPGTLLLLRRGRGNPALQRALGIYGLSLAACYAASTTYHGLAVEPRQVVLLGLIDRIGIFGLIAGTYTPIAWGLLRGRWRRGVLLLVWGAALAGMANQVARGTLPAWVSTALYLAIGWGSAFCYGEMARATSPGAMRPVLVGGLIYSVGAAIHLVGRPVPWPGVFGAHELFHVFVLAASLVHYRFILRVVVPFALAADAASSEDPKVTAGPHRLRPDRRDPAHASGAISPRSSTRPGPMAQDVGIGHAGNATTSALQGEIRWRR